MMFLMNCRSVFSSSVGLFEFQALGPKGRCRCESGAITMKPCVSASCVKAVCRFPQVKDPLMPPCPL